MNKKRDQGLWLSFQSTVYILPRHSLRASEPGLLNLFDNAYVIFRLATLDLILFSYNEQEIRLHNHLYDLCHNHRAHVSKNTGHITCKLHII